MSDSVHEVIIIGSGPAGYTAAIYSARANLKPTLFQGMQPGGQLTITTDVENFPGYPDGVMGPAMMEDLQKQAERFGTDMQFEHITEVDFSTQPFRMKSEFNEYQAKSVIIATGASARLLGLESEKTLMGNGVSACATCDGAFFPGTHVLIVGGGDSAMEEAIYLTRFASKVTVVHRREGFSASRIMLERAQRNEKIEWLLYRTVKDILAGDDGKVDRVILIDPRDGSESEMACDGIFIAIGHDPNTDLFKGKIDMDDSGYIIVHEGSRTSVDGVFACGDAMDKRYRQAITAAGTGCMAAIDAERWLEEQED
jgi:thioredoxin reductase (NADPH)